MQTKQPHLALHRKRARTRLTAFLLALTSFAGAELVTLGALSAERSAVGGLEILDASPCAEDNSALTC